MTPAIQPANDVMLAEFDDESVLLDTKSGKYYTLNDTALAIWKWAQKEADQVSIIDRVVQEFDVTREEAARDVREFFDVLIASNLARPNDR